MKYLFFLVISFFVYAAISSLYLAYIEWERLLSIYFLINIVNIVFYYIYYIIIPFSLCYLLRSKIYNFPLLLEVFIVLIWSVISIIAYVNISGLDNLQFGQEYHILEGVIMPVYYAERIIPVLVTYLVARILHKNIFASNREDKSCQ